MDVQIEIWIIESLIVICGALLAMFLFCKAKDCCDKFKE